MGRRCKLLLPLVSTMGERVAAIIMIVTVHCFLPPDGCHHSEAFTFRPIIGTPAPARHSRSTTTPRSFDVGSGRGRGRGHGATASSLFSQRRPGGGDDDGAVATASSSSSDDVREEANEALASVGWAPPTSGYEGELTSDDPFVKKIDASIQRDVGVPLDELLNPAKVVNLERDLYNLRMELAELTGVDVDVGFSEGESGTSSPSDISTESCDGGGGGEVADALRKSIEKKERSLLTERRAVFRGWLKNVFLGQAILSLGLSWIMVTNPAVLFGGFDWFEGLKLDMPIRVLGFWWWWLFIVPSLRSRRPGGMEKRALDLAFVGTPLVSLLAPVVTKDTAEIWLANLAVVVGSYAFAYLVPESDDDDGGGEDGRPEWVKFVFKSLDFGTGRERGARK